MEARDQALQRAIDEAGGPAELARFITENYEKISAQAICDWKRCPPRRVIAVEQATKGRVKRHELRPDIFPKERRAA